MISIQQMQYILTLHDTGCRFQKASELCYVTQPTLSMQVKKAEELLGHKIFDRSGNPVVLTDFGMKLIPILREIMAEQRKIQLLVERKSADFKEKIVIGVIPTIASYLVPKMFSIWKQRVDAVQLIVEEHKTHQLIDLINRKKIDLVIMAGPYVDNSAQSVPLFREEILAYAPKFKGNKITTEVLQGYEPRLLSRGNCLRTQMINFCNVNQHEESSEWSYEGGNLELLLNVVDQIGGYTLVPANYKVNQDRVKHIKHVWSSESEKFPARDVIGVFSLRNSKTENIKKLLHEVQLEFGTKTNHELFSIAWTG